MHLLSPPYHPRYPTRNGLHARDGQVIKSNVTGDREMQRRRARKARGGSKALRPSRLWMFHAVGRLDANWPFGFQLAQPRDAYAGTTQLPQPPERDQGLGRVRSGRTRPRLSLEPNKERPV